MNLSGGSGELIRAESGGWPASVAQYGPSILARNDVGVHDMTLWHGQERTSWASQLGICAAFGGLWPKLVTGQCQGLVPPKIAKAGHPCRGWK